MSRFHSSGRLLAACLFACTTFPVPTLAQAAPSSGSDKNWFVSFLSDWDRRALQAQVDQPNWLTPVVTSTARLKQEIRYDMSWQWPGMGLPPRQIMAAVRLHDDSDQSCRD